MGELVIEANVIIDEIENVLEAIGSLSGIRLQDGNVIKKFIQNETATKYYLDDRMNSKMADDGKSIYLWLDSGLRDYWGKPIFISLLKKGQIFAGHVAGTIQTLADSIRNYFPKNKSVIHRNYYRFLDKYKLKSDTRVHKFIQSEEEYLLETLNQMNEDTIFSEKISKLNLVFEDITIEETIEELIPEITEEPSQLEKEITVGILVDKIDEMEQYITELLTIIESQQVSSKEQIESLQTKNNEYKRALEEVRIFMDHESKEEALREEIRAEKQKYMTGHQLLNRKEKILVLGNTEIDEPTMKSIAKNEYGFDKGDIEFELDYKKLVGTSRRIHGSSRYGAIIFGNVPHKVAHIGSWSSIMEEYRQCYGDVLAIDARCESGGLKVTKQSFRNALTEICSRLQENK